MGRNEGRLLETTNAGDAAGFFTADVVDGTALRYGILAEAAERNLIDTLIANPAAPNRQPSSRPTPTCSSV